MVVQAITIGGDIPNETCLPRLPCPVQFKVKSHCVPVFVSHLTHLGTVLIQANKILRHHFQGKCLGVQSPAGYGEAFRASGPVLLPTCHVTASVTIEAKQNQNLVVERKWHDRYELA